MHFSIIKLFQFFLFGSFFRFYADGGNGGGSLEITPEIQALIDAAVESNVKGLKTKNEELLGKVKSAGDKLKEYDGIDPVKTREMFSRFENDAEAKLIAEGKISEVIEARTEKLRVEAEKRIKAAETAAETASQRAKAFQGRVLDDAIRAAATSSGLHKHAVEDALFRGRSLFTLDDDGKAVQLGEDGHPVLGKDGKTPFTPAEWLDSMKETAPHWFPTGNAGGGANNAGGGNNAGGKKSMSREQFDKLSPLDQAKAATEMTIID